MYCNPNLEIVEVRKFVLIQRSVSLSSCSVVVQPRRHLLVCTSGCMISSKWPEN